MSDFLLKLADLVAVPAPSTSTKVPELKATWAELKASLADKPEYSAQIAKIDAYLATL